MYQVYIFSKKEIKIVIVGTIIGGILQIVCCRYLKNHPDLVQNKNSEKLEPKEIELGPRGGALIEIAGAKLVINVAATIVFLSEKGAFTGLLITAGGMLIKKVSVTTISTIVHKALPVNHSNLEKGYILVDGEELYECDQTFKYLFKVLTSKNIPFKEKKSISFELLVNHIDFKTTAGCVHFLLCLTALFRLLAFYDIAGYWILMENLLEALKRGKISKRMARLLLRRLGKLEIFIDSKLIEAATEVT